MFMEWLAAGVFIASAGQFIDTAEEFAQTVAGE
jgi:hypothetical protein